MADGTVMHPRTQRDDAGFQRAHLIRSPQRETLSSLCRDLGPCVYFVRTNDGLIKIGHTTDLATRKRKFGAGWSRILAVVPGTPEDEAALHAQFTALLQRGREYYRPGQPLIDHINEIRQRISISPI